MHALLCSLNGCRQKGATLSLPLRDAGGSKHGPLRVLGASGRRRFPFLLQEQGSGGGALGAEKGQQEAHDLSEDVPGPQELRKVGRDLQGEEEAHLPVQPRHPDVAAEVSTRRFVN